MSDAGKLAPERVGDSQGGAGETLRDRVGALLASAVIREQPLKEIGGPGEIVALPVVVQAEADEPTDDLVVHLDDGGRVFIQSKRSASLGGRAFGEALDQFCRSVEAGLGDRDMLVLATANPSGPLVTLGVVLERLRHTVAGGLTATEAEALERFRALVARRLDGDDVDRLTRRLIVWRTDPTGGDGAGLLHARLDGHVAKAGTGANAARALAERVGRLSQIRAGLDAFGFVDELRVAGVELTDDPRLRSGVVAQVQALAGYRGRIADREGTLQLLGVSGPLADLRLDQLDAGVAVKAPPSDPSESRVPLATAIRRRGRLLLVGSGGSGKSTALRVVATEWAARPSWPVPIEIHLARLAAHPAGGLRAVVELAAETVPGVDRDRLAAALERSLLDGGCLLLLDGLDEVRRGRAALAEDLRRLLKDIAGDNEVVLATRPVAAGDAAGLDLAPVELAPPANARRTTAAIVDAAASSVDPAERGRWKQSRNHWIEAALLRDPVLADTPLTVVLLALMAVRSADLDDLPLTRAGVLRRAVLDTIEQWEVERRRRGNVRIGRLAGARAARALEDAMRALSVAALQDSAPDRDATLRLLADRLAELFDLAPGDAGAAADDALAFWDEAGFFALHEGQLTAGLRPFAELGVAWEQALSDEDPAAWLSRLRANADLWPAIGLAASLSPPIAECWALEVAKDVAAAEDASIAEAKAVAAAIHDGAQIGAAVFRELVESLLGTDLLSGDDAIDMAALLVTLPVPEPLRPVVRTALRERLPEDAQVPLETLAVAHWDEHGPEADAVLRAMLARPVPTHGPSGGTFGPAGRDLCCDAIDLAALRLARGTRADAELAAGAVKHLDWRGMSSEAWLRAATFEERRRGKSSSQFRLRLPQTLRDAGHEDLAANFERRTTYDTPEQRASTERANRRWEQMHRLEFDTAAALAPPAALTRRQRRRLDEFADLLATALPVAWDPPTGWVIEHPDAAIAWLGDAADLAGLNRSVVAAQAQLAIRGETGEDPDERDAWQTIYHEPRERELVHWSRLADPVATLERCVRALGDVNPLMTHIGVPLAEAIVNAPPEFAAAAVVERQIAERGVNLASAQVLLRCVPDTLDRARAWIDDWYVFEYRVAAAAWWAGRARRDPADLEAKRYVKLAEGDIDPEVQGAARLISSLLVIR